jgi:hypothetical protein
MNSLLIIAALIIVLWLVMLVLYLLVSREQPNLSRQIRSLEEQLDDESGRAPTDNHP